MEQSEAIWSTLHIGERRDSEHNILLYQRDDFYIEVFHHKEYNVIRRIRSFKSITKLEPYLSQIVVVSVINGSNEQTSG